MDQIAIAKQNIDIAATIESSGIELSFKYGKHSGLCPFHPDSRPSFYVYNDHYHCYGCGAHGDVIDFIQNLHGCGFKDACRHLGISTGKPTKETRTKIIELNKKREALKRYRQRERDIAFTLGTLIRWTHMAMAGIKNIKDMEDFADVYHALPSWEHYHLIFCTGEPAERRQVVEALKDIEIIERNPLFYPDFDFSAWLRNFYGALNEAST
jgi:hypothetical protein